MQYKRKFPENIPYVCIKFDSPPNGYFNDPSLRIVGSQVTSGLEIQFRTLQKNRSKPLRFGGSYDS